MSFFISDAFAEAAPGAAGQPELMSQLIVFGGIFLVFWLLFIRPQSKKMKEHKAMVEALKKGDEVVTNGGVLGKVVGLHENFVTIEISKETEINIQRMAVASLMPKGTIKSIKE